MLKKEVFFCLFRCLLPLNLKFRATNGWKALTRSLLLNWQHTMSERAISNPSSTRRSSKSSDTDLQPKYHKLQICFILPSYLYAD